MSHWDTFKTGDLCISRTSGKYASFIRGVTNSDYNHSCVAIRIDSSKLPNIKLVKTGGTLLFIEGQNLITDNRRLTTNFMDNEKIVRLNLKDEYYTPDFEQKVLELIYTDIKEVIIEPDKSIKIRIPNNFKSDIHKNDKYQPIKKLRILCSEYSANFYHITLNDYIDKRIKYPLLFTPNNFIKSENNPYYYLFDNQVLIYNSNSSNYDWLKLLAYIILIILIIIVLIFLFKSFK